METAREFGVQPILLLAQVINFLILVLLLRRFLYKPVVTMLEERKRRIAQSINQAQEIEERLASVRQEQERLIAQARLEASEIVGSAKQSATDLIAKAQAEAEGKAKAIIADAKNEIAQDRLLMHTELRQELARLVMLTVEKVLRRIISPSDQKRLVAQTIEEVSH